MKVSVVGTRGFPQIEGGVEKHCESLYPEMVQDAEITVFRRKPYVTETGSYHNISFVDLPSTKIKGLETVIHSFLATVCASWNRPDLVHYHNIGPALFSFIPKLFNIPVVLTYHSPNYEHKKWGVVAKKILRISEKVALKCSDRIIFVNRFQMEKYPEEIREKSVYIPNGIQEPEISGKTNFLKKYGLESGKYVLAVGRITPEKGFHTLIAGFRQAELSDYKLVIAGGAGTEQQYRNLLAQLAEGLPVVFTGAIFGDELAQMYSNAALFVLPSENEGFPLVLLEAMSYRRNVLVSDIPATHLVDLKEADYFVCGNVDNLAIKMKRKVTESCYREYNLVDFTWKKAAEETLRVFSDI